MIRLYDYILSADCYKVRLLCALLGVNYAPVRINPRQSIPVLEDGERRICDTNAILIHLARRYDQSGRWLPKDDTSLDHVMEWLGFAAKELDLLQTLRMRSITAGGEPSPRELEAAHSHLTIIEDH